MLASRASTAFVCIRCELRLAQPRALRSSRRPPHALFSTITSHHGDALDVLDVAEHDKTNPSEPSGPPKPSFKFKKRKSTVIERTELLRGVKALGQDAEILVLKKVGDDGRDSPSGPPAEIISEAPYAPEVLASLEAQKSKVSPEEIQEQLESFRPITNEDPHEPQYITQAAFISLTRKLLKSFNASQLSRYYSSAKGIASDSVKKELFETLRPEGNGRKLIDRTAWHPGTTSISRRLPGLWENKHLKGRRASKTLLVDQILRDVWRLVLLEEIEASGEIELTLKPWQLYLLSVGESNMSALDLVKQSRKARIEIFQPHNVLRITASKTSAEYAANDIEQMLRETESKVFNPSDWTILMEENLAHNNLQVNLTSSDLLFASSLSGTFIHFTGWPVSTQKSIRIRGLDRNSVADAERTLINLLPITTKRVHTIDTELIKKKTKSHHLVPYVFTSTLDYRFRRVPLGRWTKANWSTSVSPTQQARSTSGSLESDSDNYTPLQPDSRVLGLLKEMAGSYETPIYRPQADSEWTTIPDIKWAAEFGSALFPVRKGGTSLPSSKSRSKFSSLAPGMAKLMTANDMRMPGQYSQPFLEYEFIPYPGKGKDEELKHYPKLQMRMQLRGGPRLTSLRVYFNERYHDVLLPDQVVDIRFKFHDRIRLRDPLANPKIREFVDEVCANIQSGAKLTTPPLLDIEIPTWILPGSQSSNSKTKTITYMFSHVNHREYAELRYGGVGCRIDSIQGSKVKSKHTQVSTYFHYLNRPVRETATPESEKEYLEHQRETNEKNINNFVKTTFDMVARFTEATHTTLSMSGEAARWTELRRVATTETVSDTPAGEETKSDDHGKGEDDTKMAATEGGQLIDSTATLSSHHQPMEHGESDAALQGLTSDEASVEASANSNQDHIEPDKSVDVEDVQFQSSITENSQTINATERKDVSNDKKRSPLSIE